MFDFMVVHSDTIIDSKANYDGKSQESGAGFSFSYATPFFGPREPQVGKFCDNGKFETCYYVWVQGICDQDCYHDCRLSAKAVHYFMSINHLLDCVSKHQP